jgi:hypothetical protein
MSALAAVGSMAETTKTQFVEQSSSRLLLQMKMNAEAIVQQTML